MTDSALTIEAIEKSYGSNRVLDGISLSVEAGRTAALLGENGAGKSTLAKIIAGSTTPDAGRILLDGVPVEFASPRDALEKGIAFIPQELVYVPRLSVAENISLGRTPSRRGFTSPGAILRQARRDAESLGFDLPLTAAMDSLTLVQQQLVEVLKAFARRSRVVLLDEPTAALEAEDSERLLALTRTLAERGVATIYISHRLDEVFRTCEDIHVLRSGSLVLSGPLAATSPREVIAGMLGRPADEVTVPKQAGPATGTALAVRSLTRSTAPILSDVSFEVGIGEIVALYGVQGAGAETVAETLGGLHPDVRGSVTVEDRAYDGIASPVAAKRAGIAYVPADRKSQGLVLLAPITRSLSLASLPLVSRFGILRRRAEQQLARRLADRTLVRAQSLSQPVGELSGGNQQKVLLGSRLAGEARVLVLQEPTRGVDVGARLEIHRLLREIADGGVAQLVVTSDIEEAVILADRLLVVRGGALVGEIDKPTLASQARALEIAGGTA